MTFRPGLRDERMLIDKSSPGPDSRAATPLVLFWHESDGALPTRVIRGSRRQVAQLPIWMIPPDHIPTGPPDQPFDFCGHIGRLAAAVVARCPEFAHIDTSRMMFGATQARNGRAHGLQARVTPLRFRGGALIRRLRGRAYQVQRFIVDGREMLYVMTFCLPRFLDLDFDEKLITLFHELFHIGPEFNGDLRRHHGRYNVHTHSRKEYDRQMAHLARRYLAEGADKTLHAFLRLNFLQLRHRHRGVVGVSVPRPKLVPLPLPVSPTAY